MALVIKRKCNSVLGADLRRFTGYDLRGCTILCMEGLNSWVPALVCAVVSFGTFQYVDFTRYLHNSAVLEASPNGFLV